MRLLERMLNRDTNLNSFSQVIEMPNVLRCVWYSCTFLPVIIENHISTRGFATSENIALMITLEINVFRTPTFNIYAWYISFTFRHFSLYVKFNLLDTNSEKQFEMVFHCYPLTKCIANELTLLEANGYFITSSI